MIESSLVVNNVDEIGVVQSESQCHQLEIPREPSFSGWCDKNGLLRWGELEKTSTSQEDFDFELPLGREGLHDNVLLDKKSYSKVMFEQKMEGDGGMGDTQLHLTGNGNSNYVPFDLENASEEDHIYSNSDTTSSIYNDYRETSTAKKKHPISVAEVLKTLFFILVWYTFSTFLTLYNKTLLGDDLGKFPAPLLMNTVHFAMQAVISNFITWFWSDRFQPTATMSWKDYFVKVVPMALTTAMDVNLSNASLVFISVTFATMCKSAAPIFLLLFAFSFSGF